jgi:hypothetical protein
MKGSIAWGTVQPLVVRTRRGMRGAFKLGRFGSFVEVIKIPFNEDIRSLMM